MVGKKSGKALLREEGLERTDNNMDLTTWPQVVMINQKNYYTEYLKRDDQSIALRLLQEERRNRMTASAKDRDRALAQAKPNDLPPQDVDMDMDDDAGLDDMGSGSGDLDASGTKVIVIHPGSQNLRIGLASDPLPKSVPMVIARKWKHNEWERDGGEPKPKRIKLDNGSTPEPEKMFGQEFASLYNSMCADLKLHMRANKRRVLPNSKELVVNYNSRISPEEIPEHNDPDRIDWTEIPRDPKEAPDYFTGTEAQRIPDESNPRYKLFWPLQRGWYSEHEYDNKMRLYEDISTIIEEAIKTQLNLPKKKEWVQYGCVFVIPDLYERQYVVQILEMLMRDFGFGRVCFIQESLAATFGAGFTSACIVDVGAQKTSICCVEEGMCVENSRVNLKIGGADVTETFVKMMLFDHFPYADIDLRRRYDFLLAEELKYRICTFDETFVTVQLHDCHLRAPGQDTKKYQFKTYDEMLLAPRGFCQPAIFDHSEKLKGRRKLIARSEDLYDGSPNDPVSSAQSAIIQLISPQQKTDVLESTTRGEANGSFAVSTPQRQALNSFSRINDPEFPNSAMGSPVPEGDGTPAPAADGTLNGTPNVLAALIRDDVLPVLALDEAIIISITHGARGDEKKMRDFYGGIMVIGGGSASSPNTPNHPNTLLPFLEQRLKERKPNHAKDIMIGPPPRDLDPQVVVWKGASIFGKLRGTNDSWIGRLEYDRLGARLLAYKCMWSCPSTTSMANPNRQHVVHQDYIVRQRYQNPLPPPPGSVKHLIIPTEGLAAYTSPEFAAGLARSQPINIEADAFLGMPLDLIGMPGIFDGDESSIQAPLVTPPVHPRDKNLLRPLKSLGVPKTEASGVSFLRRTQYTAEDLNRRNADGSSRKLGTAAVRKRKPADISKNEPISILRDVVKGFDIANPEDIYKGPDTESNIRGAVPTAAELEAWRNPVHPSKPHLKPVGMYPIFPDLEATTDDGGYMIARISGLPTDITEHHDPKMDAALLHPLELSAEQYAAYQAQAQAYEADPAHNPAPTLPAFDYEFFLPHDDITTENYKLKVDVENPKKDDPKLYTYNSHGGPDNDSFRFDKVREYETGLQSDNNSFKYQEVALVLHDPTTSTSRLPKGAYYYPIVSKVQLKPRRGTYLAQAGLAAGKAGDERQKIDVALVAIREPNETEAAKRDAHKAKLNEGAAEASK